MLKKFLLSMLAVMMVIFPANVNASGSVLSQFWVDRVNAPNSEGGVYLRNHFSLMRDITIDVPNTVSDPFVDPMGFEAEMRVLYEKLLIAWSAGDVETMQDAIDVIGNDVMFLYTTLDESGETVLLQFVNKLWTGYLNMYRMGDVPNAENVVRLPGNPEFGGLYWGVSLSSDYMFVRSTTLMSDDVLLQVGSIVTATVLIIQDGVLYFMEYDAVVGGPSVIAPGPEEIEPGPEEIEPGPEEIELEPEEIEPEPEEIESEPEEIEPEPEEIELEPEEIESEPEGPELEIVDPELGADTKKDIETEEQVLSGESSGVENPKLNENFDSDDEVELDPSLVGNYPIEEFPGKENSMGKCDKEESELKAIAPCLDVMTTIEINALEFYNFTSKCEICAMKDRVGSMGKDVFVKKIEDSTSLTPGNLTINPQTSSISIFDNIMIATGSGLVAYLTKVWKRVKK